MIKYFLMKHFLLMALVATFSTSWAQAPSGPRLTLPAFSSLADKASESVNITLDPSLLALAARFLDAGNPEDAAAKQIIQGLQGIYVRSYTFDQDFTYMQSDLDVVRAQLTAPGWNRVVQTSNRKTHASVDVYLMTIHDHAAGLAVIAIEARQLTIVNIVGAIDLEKLRKLEGQFGIPKFNVGTAPPAPR